MLEFRILGPLEVACGSDVIALGGAKQRALLACLLLHPNEVVSSDSLLDNLWGDAAPASARKIVQLYVSRLRKSLGDDALTTRSPGYVLPVEPEQLDAQRFAHIYEEAKEALAAGKAREAAETLREALELWRGPALADFLYEPWAQTHAARLEELRLAAISDRVEADLALGREAEIVGELEALIAEHPLRERLRSQLMLALYRCGRQADALTVYQDARRTLVDELGIEPRRSCASSSRRSCVRIPTSTADRPRPTRGPLRRSGASSSGASGSWPSSRPPSQTRSRDGRASSSSPGNLESARAGWSKS